MVADMTDDEIWALNRGGHDPRKVYAAYAAAVAHTGQPTVILAKTIKGYGMGEAGEGQNITHQQKKMTEEALLAFRDRFELPLTDEQVARRRLLQAAGATRRRWSTCASAARRSAAACRRAGARPRRCRCPELSAFEAQLERHRRARDLDHDGVRARAHRRSLRDKQLGPHVVPIVPDESRTFGMEGMFRQLGIFSQVGQLYTPEDAEQLMFYREDKKGQILQEGINEAGRVLVLDRRGDVVLQPRRADDPVLHLLLDVRLPAGRRPRLGRRRQRARAGSCSAAPRGARRSTARGCSTRTATRTCWRRRSRTASPTTRPTATSSR